MSASYGCLAMTCKRSYLIATFPALGGLLLGLSFPPVDWHWLAWVALVPIAWCWTQPQLPRSAYWSAFGGGVVFHLLALDWLRHCYLDSQAWFGPYTDGWVILSLMNGLIFLGFFGYGRWLIRATRLPMALVLPAAWVTFELVRHHASVLVDQTGFPWAKLAVTQADWLELIQIADLGGEYLLSFLIAMVGGAIVAVSGSRGNRSETAASARSYYSLFVFALLVGVVVYGKWRIAESDFQPGPLVCLMSKHDSPTSIDRDRIETETADLLVWPELTLHVSLIDTLPSEELASWPSLPLDVATQVGLNLLGHAERVRHDLVETARDLDATLLIGCERLEPGPRAWRRYNSIAHVDPQLGIVGCYDKCYPVPWAEFMPYVTNRVDSDDEDNFRRGNAPAQFDVRVRGGEVVYRCRPVLCYDLCFASFFRKEPKRASGLASAGPADFFVHSGSEGQDRTGVLAKIMLRAARFRAVETRRAIVRNVSQGTSGILDSNGHLRVALPGLVVEEPVLLGAIPIDHRRSLYARLGDWPMILLCAMFAVASIISRCGRA